jgi:hypothetical protein
MNIDLIPGVSEELMGDVAVRVKELMKNNIKLPLIDKAELNRDKEHLEFIYARLIHVYQEQENIDFMIKLKQIIDGYER